MKLRGLVSLTLVLSLVLCAASAFAGASDSEGFYLGIKGGYHWTDQGSGLSDTDPNVNATGSFSDEDGFTVGGALGYDWSSYGLNLRSELEYLYYEDINYSGDNATGGNLSHMSADVNVQTLMVNLYYDFETDSPWVPYVGAGAGMAFISTDVDYDANWAGASNGDSTATNFAWMATLGCAYEFNANWALDLSARYSGFGDGDSISTNGDTLSFRAKDLSAFDTLLGVRYTF